MQAGKGFQEVLLKDNGIMNKAVLFVLNNQLKDRVQWRKCTEVFTTKEDSEQGRWRGEYFGKQMRGAALIYRYTQDEELYAVLTETVLDLLERQDELGRFSTYTVAEEFRGWDIWCRKYVLVGFLYYCEICKDKGLKTRIIAACQRHLDYILDKIGAEEGKLAITATSHWWGCVNSCTLLEPTVELYKVTGEKRYLDFAKYILSTGGCSDCNLIELALHDKRYPYQYPVTKAYEMMSFYEGLLAYYEVTGERQYFEAAVRFMDLVAESDVTIIGCSGCTHELFDNSSVMQTEYHENIMQETCVTVTWMRVNRRLFQLTGDVKYIDRIEIAGYNALYGSLNTELNKQLSMETGKYVEPMAFDSYSPLYMNTRGRGIGGYNEFASGGYNGCCVAIGACGVALMPLTAVMQSKEKIYLNFLFNGEAWVQDVTGKTVCLSIESGYPADGMGKITVGEACTLALCIRKPSWCIQMSVDGESVEDGYYNLCKTFRKGEGVTIEMQVGVKVQLLNGKIAFQYGALTLATDAGKSNRDLRKPVLVKDGACCVKVRANADELVRFACDCGAGETLILSDYQSCGKHYASPAALMTVWFDRDGD